MSEKDFKNFEELLSEMFKLLTEELSLQVMNKDEFFGKLEDIYRRYRREMDIIILAYKMHDIVRALNGMSRDYLLNAYYDIKNDYEDYLGKEALSMLTNKRKEENKNE
jgi:hypothetical protein